MTARDTRTGAAPATAVRSLEPLWRTRDVAAYLGVDPKTVTTFIAMGLPTIRLPGSRERTFLRFDPEEVRAWALLRKTHSVLDILDRLRIA